MATDPICGMSVPETPAALQRKRGPTTYYFCSAHCLRTFEAPDQEIRKLRVYTAAAFLAGAAMLVLTFVYTPWDMATTNLVMLALATPIQFVAGARFYGGLFHALRARAANMDTLIALGTTTAYGYSAIVAFFPERYGMETYFDTSVLIIAFILLGNSLEYTMKRRAVESMRALVSLQPRTARVVRGEAEAELPVEQLRLGDRFTLRPGERVPTDGRIVEGASELDESMVTGESIPVAKKVGDTVIGGTINTNGALVVEAIRVGADTLLSQIVGLVEQAQSGRAPIQRLVDRVSAWFVPTVLLVAAGSAAAWFFVADAGVARSALVFVAVVIIACPCALGLATPAALLVAVGRGAQHGLLVKDAAQLEKAARLNLILFDKTGTLTEGRPTVTDIVAVPGPSQPDVLHLAAALEQHSEHPLGAAIVRAASLQGATPVKPTAFESVPGQGVRGTVGDQRIVVGKPDWLHQNGIDVHTLETEKRRLQGEGKTVLYVGRGTSLLGLIALADTLRPGAEPAIRRLKELGVEPWLITGDHEPTARAVSAKVGIERFHAEVLPADKAAIVERHRSEGRVVGMVGDGVNDAPALAAADVGIALGSGTDVARESGGLLLLKNDPRDVANAIELARRTRSKIRQNLFWAFLYNVALIPVAAFGLLDPILAGAAMGLSSVTVVGNALLLRTFKPSLESHGAARARPPGTVPTRPRTLAMAPSPAMEGHPDGAAADPVCGMRVDPARARFRHAHGGRTYFFCSASCHDRFAKEPARFLKA